MSTDNLHMTITALDKASPIIDGLISKMKQLTSLASKVSANPVKGIGSLNTGQTFRDDFTKAQNNAMKGLRQRFTMESRMNRQRVNEERAVSAEQSRTARIAESDVMRLFRIRMRSTANVMRMNGVAEREAERSRARTIAAEERAHASSIRRQIQGHRYLFGLRERMDREERRSTEQASKADDRRRAAARRSFGSAGTHARDAGRGLMDTARTVTVYGGIAGGIAGKIAQTGLSARSRADTAEANLRMFGGQTRQQVNEARTGWINKSAVENGFRPADAINAFTEALKAGIPAASAPDVTKSIMGASAGLDLNVAETTKLVGRLSTLTQAPKAFSAGAIDTMLNGIAVIAKVTAADSNELVSSLRRGAGVLGSSKMSVTDLTAFTGTAISAGMQEGKAGTFMDFQVNELVNAKNARGQRRADLSKGLKLAGMPDLATTSRQMAQDPTAYLEKLYGNVAKMGPEKAGQVANLIGMREWRGEILMMVKAFGTLRQAIAAGRDPANAGHLAQARNEKLGTLAGLGSQLRATADLAFEAIGGGMEDVVRDFSRFFVDLSGKLNLDVIKAHVASLLNGFVDGLGFASVTEMLNRIFGSPDFSTVDSFFRFAQGFGKGVREVIDTLRSAFSMFTGQDATAETVGKLTAKFLGYAAAMVAAGPAIAVLGSLSAILLGLGSAASAVVAGAKGLGLIGGVGMAGGTLALIGGGIATAFLATIADKLGILKAPDVSKGWGRGILDFLDPGIASRLYGDDKGERSDPPARVQRQSLTTENPLQGLIQKASMTTGYDGRDDAIERLSDNVRTMGARFQLAALSGPGTGSGLGSSLGGGGGGGAGGGSSPSSKFFKPDGMSVPGWYGKGSGSGGGKGGALGVPDIGPMTADERNKLGLIMKYEGGYKNQMNYMGKRQGLDPNTAKGYTAQGYFQILNSNWRRLASKLGITTTNAMSSSLADQSKVALALMRENPNRPGGGIQNWSNYNPALRSALARGEKAPAGGIPGGDGVAGISPNLGGLTPSLDGLRVKSGEATAGGATHPAILAAAQMIQKGNMAGGVNRFTAFNDLYHKGTGSKHASGLAGDFTLKDASKSGAAAEQVRQMFRSAGLPDNAFKVIDEYRNPSSRATGGHIHYQINSAKAAAQYAEAVSRRSVAAAQSVAKIATDAAKATAVSEGVAPQASGTTGDMRGTGLRSSGWQPGAGTSNRSAITGVPDKAEPMAQRAIGNVPMPPRRPAGVGAGGGGAGGNLTIHTTVNGAGENPGELANKVQRQISKDWNHRSHDVEFDMA